MTNINYSLPANSDVTLEVRDIKGSRVATIDRGFRAGGDHQVSWSPAGQPAGIYYLVLNTGNDYQVKKMIKLN